MTRPSRSEILQEPAGPREIYILGPFTPEERDNPDAVLDAALLAVLETSE